MINAMNDQLEQFRRYLGHVMIEKGLTPTEVARMSGVATTTITRPIYKPETASAPTLRTIAKVAAATGVAFDPSAEYPSLVLAKMASSLEDNGGEPARAARVVQNVRYAPDVRVPLPAEMPRDLPVRGIAACSSGDGAFQFDADVVDWVRRPPLFNGVPEAYALYMSGESMEPRLFHGDLVMVHPFRPVRPGDLAIFVLKDAPDEPEYAFCKRFLSDRAGVVTVEQYNPALTREFPRERIVAKHRVMDLGDLFGA